MHDAESPDLVELEPAGRTPLRVHRALVETDLVSRSARAETVLDGGPSRCSAPAARRRCARPTAYSLLETGASQGWRLAVELERQLAGRVPLIGTSLVLDQPRLHGAARGYPYEPEALERIARSPLRRGFGALPAPFARNRLIQSRPARAERGRCVRWAAVGRARRSAAARESRRARLRSTSGSTRS